MPSPKKKANPILAAYRKSSDRSAAHPPAPLACLDVPDPLGNSVSAEPEPLANHDAVAESEEELSEGELEAAAKAGRTVVRKFRESWKEFNQYLRYSERTGKMYCLCCGQTETTGSRTLKASAVKDHVNGKGQSSTSRRSHAENAKLYEARMARDVQPDKTMEELLPQMQSDVEAKYAVTLRAMGHLLDKGSPFSHLGSLMGLLKECNTPNASTSHCSGSAREKVLRVISRHDLAELRSDLLTGTNNILPFRLTEEFTDDLRSVLRISMVRDVPLPASVDTPAASAELEIGGVHGADGAAAVAGTADADVEHAGPMHTDADADAAGSADAAAPAATAVASSGDNGAGPSSPAPRSAAAGYAADSLEPQLGARTRRAPARFAHAADESSSLSPTVSRSLSPARLGSDEQVASSPQLQADLLMTDDESGADADDAMQADEPRHATRASAAVLLNADKTREQQDEHIKQLEELLIDKPCDLEAGALPAAQQAPLTLERFLALALAEEDPHLDTKASAILCSKAEFRDAACRAAEEAQDALREVLESIVAYFPWEALEPFRIFSPDYHSKVAARHANKVGRAHQDAVYAELCQHSDTLADRYSKDLTGSYGDEQYTVPRSMSRTKMRSEVMALHRLMLRSQGKSAYSMAAGIASGQFVGVEAFKAAARVHQVLPLSSADAERMFSTMNYLHDELRNRLQDQNLNAAMRAYNSCNDYRRRDYAAIAASVKHTLYKKDNKDTGTAGAPRDIVKRPGSVRTLASEETLPRPFKKSRTGASDQ